MTDTPPTPHTVGDEPHSLTCRDVIMDLLARYIEKSTSPELTSAIDAHFRDCPPCIGFVASYEATRQAVRSLQYEEVPPELTERLRELVRREAALVRRESP